MIVVYLSNQNIRVAEGEYVKGTVKIKGLHHIVDHQGCIINGSVTDKEGLQELLKELWENEKLPRKDVALVINSSQFTTRVLDVPQMKPAQTIEYIRREFADVERIEDPVHSYFPMPGQKKGKVVNVFAGVASKGYLSIYQQLFEEIGIHLTRIEVVLGPLLRMIDALEMVKGRTCIIQFVNEAILFSILYVKGKHVYSSRSRLFSNPGTPEFAVEAARSVSNILQFAKSQNIEEQINEVFVAGMDDATMEVFSDSVQRINENLETTHLQPGRIFQFPKEYTISRLEHYVLSLGAFWPVPEKMGFLAQMMYDPVAEEKKEKRRKTIIPLTGLGIAMVIISIALFLRLNQLKGELKEIKEYIESPSVSEACQKYDSIFGEVNVRRALLEEAQKLQKTINGYPPVTSRTEAVVSDCAASLVTATVTGYRAQSGILTIDTVSDQMEKIYQFVGRLEDQDIFEEINYTGYRQTSEGRWTMTVECKMKGIQEEEEDAETDGEG